MDVLEIRDLSYSYDNRKNILSGVTMALETGKMYAILGPSGSGKTTLLSLLGGLDIPVKGNIRFNCEDISEKGLGYHRRNRVAMVFQNYNLIDYMTPVENVKLTAKKSELPILERLGITAEEAKRNVLKLYCSRCGHMASRFNGGSKEHVRYYFCCRHCDNDIKAEQNLTRTPKLTQTALDDTVMETLWKQIDSLIEFDSLIGQLALSEAHNRNRQELSRERAKWEKVMNSADKTLSAAYSHHLDDLLDLREFELVREKVERDKQDAAARLSAIEADLRKHGDMADRHSHWRKVYDGFHTAETPTKSLIQALISRIELTPMTNKLHVVLNYEDGLEEYRKLLCDSGVNIDA